MRASARDPKAGLSTLEALISVLLVAVALLASLRLTVAVLGVIGKRPAGAATAAEARPARLRSVATAWAQAELEFIKQIGFDNACPASATECVLWAPRNAAGDPSAFPAPYDVGPAPPPDFRAVRIHITWDPRAPVITDPDDSTAQLRLLRLVRVDLYLSEADSRPFLTAYTSLSRRR